MKGLSIGRAELVSRFLSEERQRLRRSVELCSFQSEMRRQSDLLAGGAPSRAPFPARPVKHGQGAVKELGLGLGLSKRRRTHLGEEKSEKPTLEIADPLLLQEILAAFSASAEARKKTADRTGDQGALPVEDLVAMLEKGEDNPLFEGEVREEIPAEVFRKLMSAIRWCDDKRKAFLNAGNPSDQDAYDRRSLIEALKSLLNTAQAQRDVANVHQPFDVLSPPDNKDSAQDAMGLAGMGDAVPEDFRSFSGDGPFHVWQKPADGQQFGKDLTASEKTEAHEANKARETFSPQGEVRQSRGEKNLLWADAQNSGPKVPEGAWPGFLPGISEEALENFAQPMALQGSNFWSTALGAFPDDAGPSSLSSPDDALAVPQQDRQPWEIFGRPSAAPIPAAPRGETSPAILSGTADAPFDGPEANPGASMDMAGEIHAIASDFSGPLDAASAEELFTDRHIFVHEMGNGSGSPSGDSSPFGESARQNGHNFFQAAHQGSAEGAVFSELAAAPPSRTPAPSPSATLSLLHADWPRELGQSLSHWARSGKNFMTLELQPESLGKLFLRVETDGTRVSAVVQAEHPEAREILQRNTASLKDVLAEQGLQLSRFSVDVRHENTSFAERDLTRWMTHNETRTPSTASKGDQGEDLVNLLPVYDTGLGGVLSVRV